MLKAILVSLLFVVSSEKLSCNNALCLQDTFQGIEASGDCSECAKIIFNWLMGLVEGKHNFFPSLLIHTCKLETL